MVWILGEALFVTNVVLYLEKLCPRFSRISIKVNTESAIIDLKMRMTLHAIDMFLKVKIFYVKQF